MSVLLPLCFYIHRLLLTLVFLVFLPMSSTEISSEDYTSVLRAAVSSLPPFLQSDGKPSLPLFAWLAAFNGSLLAYQVFGGREVDLTDVQKIRLLADLLGENGKH